MYPQNGGIQWQLTKTGLSLPEKMARADWVQPDFLGLVLQSLMPANRLVLLLMMQTGLRVGDALALRSEQLRSGQRITIKEEKTGKSRRIYIKRPLYDALLAQCGRWWVFPGRLDERKHRCRQAVWKDLKRSAALWRAPLDAGGKPNWGTHTARKVWAVAELKRTGDIKTVQREMNHSSPEITYLYALADVIATRRSPAGGAQKATTKRPGRG